MWMTDMMYDSRPSFWTRFGKTTKQSVFYLILYLASPQNNEKFYEFFRFEFAVVFNFNLISQAHIVDSWIQKIPWLHLTIRQRGRVAYKLIVNEGAAPVDYLFKDNEADWPIVLVQNK